MKGEEDHVDIYLSDSAVKGLQALIDYYIGDHPAREAVVLNLIISDNIPLFGLVPAHIKINRDFCFEISGMFLYFEKARDYSDYCRRHYVDFMNGVFFMRSRSVSQKLHKSSVVAL